VAEVSERTEVRMGVSLLMGTHNHRDYGEHVASKFDVENMKSAYSVDPPSDFPNYVGDTRRAEAPQGLFARQRHQWLLPTEFVVIINQKGDIR
jgi:hypothetical protein